MLIGIAAVLVVLLAVPVYLANGAGAHLVARALGQASPGLFDMVVLSLIGGALAISFVVAVAYYGTIAAYRTGLDPDAVARVVEHALTTRTPRTRYLVGRDARLRAWLQRLPDRMRDRVIAKRLGETRR